MNHETDDSLVSAYLDGELETSARSTFEASLASNPRLVEELKRVTFARDLVSGLFRSGSPRDMSGPVLAKLPPKRKASAVEWRVWLGLGTGVVAAAGLLMAVSFAFRPRPAHTVNDLALIAEPPALGAAGQGPADAKSVDARPLPKIRTNAVASLRSNSRSSLDEPKQASTLHKRALSLTDQGYRAPESLAAPGAPAVASLGLGIADKRERMAGLEMFKKEVAQSTVDPVGEVDREKLLSLLDRRDARRILILADAIGGGSDRLDQIVRETPRKDPDYGRISLSQGVVIDPEHPNRAIVFALVVDEPELKRLRQRLELEFHDRVSPDLPAALDMVAQLAEAGDFAILPGEPLPKLIPGPPGELLADNRVSGLKRDAEIEGPIDVPSDQERPQAKESGASRSFALAPEASSKVARSRAAVVADSAKEKKRLSESASSGRIDRDLKSGSVQKQKQALASKPAAAHPAPGSMVVLVWMTTRNPAPLAN